MTDESVDLVVLSRDSGPFPRELELALRGQLGVRLVIHRIIGSPRASDANRWQTIARARNVAKTFGNSPWLMFVDDDVVPDAHCVRHLLDGLKRRPAYGALAADYLGESGSGAPRGHVGMGATLFRRAALARVQFRWSAGHCECRCCCDDLRAMGIGIGYLPAARARHRKRSDVQSCGIRCPAPMPLPGKPAPRVLAAFDRRHYDKFRRQFLASLRRHANGEPVTAVTYGLYPSELCVLASQPNVEVWPLPASRILPPVRRLRDFQDVVARLPSETPVAYWDAGDVVFQDSLSALWGEVAAHPDKLFAVREPKGHPHNRAVAAWTLTIRNSAARRRAFGLLSNRPFLNSGFAAGTAATLLDYLREADRLRAGPDLVGSADWGDQTVLNFFCHTNPARWRETEEGWNYCLHDRRAGEVIVGQKGRFLSRRGTPVRVVHGNARSMDRYQMSPYLL